MPEKQIFQIFSELKILNLENGNPRNLKEKTNTDKNSHYAHSYSADLQAELEIISEIFRLNTRFFIKKFLRAVTHSSDFLRGRGKLEMMALAF